MIHHPDEADAGPSQRSVEAGTAIAIMAFGLIVIAGSVKAGIDWGAEGPRAGFFPFYIGVIIVAASLFNLVQALAKTSALRVFASWTGLRQVLSVVVPTAVYVLVVPRIGIYAASALLIAVFMRWLGHYAWLTVAAIAVGVPAIFFLVFEYWFLVPLPKGPLEELLGL